MLKYNYHELLKNYEKEMLNTLRDFNNFDEMLRLWVPDDDPHKSIFNLIVSVCENGGNKISIDYDENKISKKINQNLLKKNIKNLGNIYITKNNEIMNIIFEKDNNKNYEINISTDLKIQQKKYLTKKIIKRVDKEGLLNSYLENTKKYSSSNYNKKIVQQENNQIKIEAQFDLIQMFFFINTKNFMIENCSFNLQYKNQLYINFFNLFCELIINTPIYEARDHGIIKLENKIRSKIIIDKIDGILVPKFLTNLFDVPQKLIDKAYEQSSLLIKNIPDSNEYDFSLGKRWKNMNLEKKEGELKKIIEIFENSNDINSNSIIFKKIEFNTRIVVYINNKRLDYQKILMKLEYEIKEKLDKRLELYYDEMLDGNKLRIKNSPQNLDNSK